MRNLILNFLIITFTIFIFTGCAQKNQISVLNDVKSNDINVYIDTKDIYTYEKLLLNQLQKDLKEGILVNTFYIDKDISFTPTNLKDIPFTYYNNTNIFIQDDYDLLRKINKIDPRKEKLTESISFETIVSDNTIEINKNYSNKLDILNDYFMISQYLIKTVHFTQNYGYTIFYLDDDGFKNNKLILKSMLSQTVFIEQILKQLQNEGYNVVNNKEQSDVTISLENAFFLKTNVLKFVKRPIPDTKLVQNYNNTSSIGQIGLNTASLSGANNSVSAAIGLALFSLDLLFSKKKPQKGDLVNGWIIDVSNSKNSSEKLRYLFEVESNPLKYHISVDTKNELAQRVVNLLKYGRTRNARDVDLLKKK